MKERIDISVIIPAFNCPEQLERCLESLKRSTAANFECIVVDDASTVDLRPLAERYRVRFYRQEKNAGPGRARNRGAELARGDLLLFIDSDVCVHTDTIARVVQHLTDNPEAVAVMGSYDDAPADPGFVSQYKNLFHHYIHQRSSTHAWTFWSGCGAMRKQVFTAAGGFDSSYGRPSIEDIELGFRLSSAGERIDLNPAIQVKHLKRWTMTSLVRTDFFDRALPWLAIMLEHRTMPPDLNVNQSHRVSVVLVYALLLGLALAALRSIASLFAAAPLPGATPLAALMLVAVVLLLVLNFDLYRFFARKRGALFALRSIPLHWFYYAYCGLAVVWAGASHLRRGLAHARAAEA